MLNTFIALLIIMMALGLMVVLSLDSSAGSGKYTPAVAMIIIIVSFVAVLMLTSISLSHHLDITATPNTDSVYYLASITLPRDNPDIIILGIQSLDIQENKTSDIVNFYETRTERVMPEAKAGDYIKISATGEVTKWDNPFANQTAR